METIIRNSTYDLLEPTSDGITDKDVIWLYTPFAMASLLNLQYALWACCTDDARAWRHHRNAAFARSFFLLLANVWVTNLLHGVLVVTANVVMGSGYLQPVAMAGMYSETDDPMTGLRSHLGKWYFVFRVGVPLTVATRAWSNLVAIALAMHAEATLASASSQTDCKALAKTFRSRLLAIIFGLWAVDCFLVFTPFLASYVHEVFLLTVLYAWIVYISVLAILWVLVLCGVVYRRAKKIHRADAKQCPAAILNNIKKKIAVIIAMSLVIYVTLLPWPICEVVYVNRDVYDIVMTYVTALTAGMNKTLIYSYVRILPYVHFVAESLLVVLFRETRWRFCLGQRGAMGAGRSQKTEPKGQRAMVEAEILAKQKLQDVMFSEHLEQLRVHLYTGSAYSTLSRETSV